MTTPTYSADDYKSALQALMPTGKVWPRDPDAVQSKVIGALVQVYARQTARSIYLLRDVQPANTLELLPEWENTLGLPDPCAGDSPTLQQRRAQVVARLTSVGGQSAEYFERFAANLGYPITVQNFAPFRSGQSTAGSAVGGVEWFFVWAINSRLQSYTLFRAGSSAAGEPLAAWGNNVLECELQSLAPAHTILQFRYTPDFDQLVDGLDQFTSLQSAIDALINVSLPNSIG